MSKQIDHHRMAQRSRDPFGEVNLSFEYDRAREKVEFPSLMQIAGAVTRKYLIDGQLTFDGADVGIFYDYLNSTRACLGLKSEILTELRPRELVPDEVFELLKLITSEKLPLIMQYEGRLDLEILALACAGMNFEKNGLFSSAENSAQFNGLEDIESQVEELDATFLKSLYIFALSLSTEALSEAIASLPDDTDTCLTQELSTIRLFKACSDEDSQKEEEDDSLCLLQ